MDGVGAYIGRWSYPAARGMKPAEGASCVCDDAEYDQVLELMAAGATQREASLVVWGPGPDVRLWVRRQFAAAFPWLRLPPMGPPR